MNKPGKFFVKLLKMSTLSAGYLLASETQLVAWSREQIMLTCSFNNTLLSSNQNNTNTIQIPILK